MTVADYLRSQNMSVRHLERLSGVSEATIRNLKRGANGATYENARRIEAATGGAVTVHEVCDPRGEIEERVQREVAERARASPNGATEAASAA